MQPERVADCWRCDVADALEHAVNDIDINWWDAAEAVDQIVERVRERLSIGKEHDAD